MLWNILHTQLYGLDDYHIRLFALDDASNDYGTISVANTGDMTISTIGNGTTDSDLSLVPDGWEVEKWMYYAQSMKFGFVDSFNEGKKGQSTGKLAGNISTQNKVLDMETGNYIQQHIQLLEFTEQKILPVLVLVNLNLLF